jgi:hypothetical protein
MAKSGSGIPLFTIPQYYVVVNQSTVLDVFDSEGVLDVELFRIEGEFLRVSVRINDGFFATHETGCYCCKEYKCKNKLFHFE